MLIFIYARNAAVKLFAFTINQIRHGVGCVGAGRYRGRMIRQNHDFIIVLSVEIVKDYRHYTAVNKLDCFDFIFGLVSVTALVGSLDMDIDKVLTFTPFVDCSVRFALKFVSI